MPELKILFLTGQSNSRSCALTPDQRRVARVLTDRGFFVGELNFPYDRDLEPYTKVNILSASLANAKQYLSSRQPGFNARYRDDVMQQLESGNRYLILAGNCGLELINNLSLPNNVIDAVHIIAYGPVARAIPDANVTVVQGRRDWISRLFVKRNDHPVDCGHMGYLSCPEFVDLVLDRATALTR